MLRIIQTILFVVPALAVFSQQTSNPLRTPLELKVDSLVRASFARGELAGVVIGVIDGDKSYTYAYGETAIGNGRLPDAQTLFQIGSITKTFTGILLASQIVDGKVKADDPISQYVPDSVKLNWFEGKVVTMQMLSNHTSAIPRWEPVMKYPGFTMAQPYGHFRDAQLYDFLNRYKPTEAPARRYDYSNIAAGLLGELLARNAKTSYKALLARDITRPLKMTSTTITESPALPAHMSQGYNREKKPEQPWVMAALTGAGGITSNMKDMLAYARANMAPPAGKLGKAITLSHRQTFADSTAIIALGWHISRTGGHTIVQHGGQTGGYNSYIGVDVAARKAVIVLSNVATANQIGWPLQMYLMR